MASSSKVRSRHHYHNTVMTMNWVVQLMVQINGTEHWTMVCHYTHSGHSGVSLVAFHWVANILYNGFSRSHNANKVSSTFLRTLLH